MKRNPSTAYARHALFELGLTETKTPAQNMVMIYNGERTLWDILRKENHADIALIFSFNDNAAVYDFQGANKKESAVD